MVSVHAPAKEDLVDISGLIDSCIQAEQARNVSKRSIKELQAHLMCLREFCRQQKVRSLQELTPSLLKDFLLYRNPEGKPPLGKALVWTLRKFGAHLALLQRLDHNPAAALSHPKISPRHTLPQYLTPAELRQVLESAHEKRPLKDFTVLSLLATVGARPHEIAGLCRADVHCSEQYVMIRVKGNWYKRTPISAPMAELLEEYIQTLDPHQQRLFLNQWKRPVNTHWIQRMVREAGREAGIQRRIQPIMFRHTFATYAADRHGKIVTRALLGHCNLSHSTAVYMHLIPSKFRVLMNRHPYQTRIRRVKP